MFQPKRLPPPPPLASAAALPLAALVLACAAAGCMPLSGTTSLTVLSAETPKGLDVAAAPVEERACMTWAAVLGIWGDPASHESLVARALSRAHADVLVDAQVESSTYGFPYLYVRSCETVRGRPARRTIARAP